MKGAVTQSVILVSIVAVIVLVGGLALRLSPGRYSKPGLDQRPFATRADTTAILSQLGGTGAASPLG